MRSDWHRFIYVDDDYNEFGIKNEICSFYSLFTGAFERIYIKAYNLSIYQIYSKFWY